MSESFPTKQTIVLNAIAITTALGVISGYVPLNMPLHQLQALLTTQQAK